MRVWPPRWYKSDEKQKPGAVPVETSQPPGIRQSRGQRGSAAPVALLADNVIDGILGPLDLALGAH